MYQSRRSRSSSPKYHDDRDEQTLSRSSTQSSNLHEQTEISEPPSWLTELLASKRKSVPASKPKPKPMKPGSLGTPQNSSGHRKFNSVSARGGRIRGTNLKPTRGYIARVASFRERSRPSSSHHVHPRKDTYPAPSDEDEYTMQDAPITSRIGHSPRRSSRQVSIRPGGYTIPALDESDGDSTTFESPHGNNGGKGCHTEDLNDSDSEVVTAPTPQPQRRRQFIIGLDYGTTFTSVSYATYPAGDKNTRLFPENVKSIRNWPRDGMGGAREQVPTEVWYPETPFSRVPDRDMDSSESERDSGSETDQEMDSEPESRHVTPYRATVASRNGWAAVNRTGTQPAQSSTTGPPRDFLWGYQIPHQIYRCRNQRDILKRVERPKLMLVTSQYTEGDRRRLRPHLENLIKHNLIKKYDKGKKLGKWDVRNVIEDFLTKVLMHTKQQLIQLENLTEDCPVSFALTVPSIWSATSSRVMQTAIEKAIRASQFGTLGHGSVDNLFIVSEAEAGATYTMACLPRTMLANETFAFMDCGGGTVDIITYKVTNSYPLRLKTEVGKSIGDNCGASYLNDAFQKHLEARLSEEDYLENNGETIADIVRQAVPDFEDFQKRDVDIYSRPWRELLIRGLRGDRRRGLIGADAKRFEDNCVFMNEDDYNAIFVPTLERVETLLRKQLEAAIEKDKEIKKVFLIGGFGAAPSLRSHLKRFLLLFVEERGLPYEISLIEMNEQKSITAVASGAVLRAMNLEQGPKRKAFSNYGFLRRQLYQPEIESGHEEAEPFLDKFDEELYVKVIDYFMIKGDILDTIHEFGPLKCTHAFSVKKRKLLCQELLYVNDSDIHFSYAVTHRFNKDAQIAGKIVVDMSRLIEDGTIQPNYSMDEHGRRKGKLHYEVSFDLLVTVEARNLRYEARYPCSDEGDPRTWETGQVSIAAAFKPGTG